MVRHGLNRGPHLRLRRFRPPLYQPLFDDLSRRWHETGRSIRFWETGRPQPDLDDVRAVVFLLRDPLRELHPDCFDDAAELACRARNAEIRLVNPPWALSNSIKSTQSRLWRAAGLPTPACDRFDTIEQLHELVRDMPFPIMLKSDRQHAQERMVVCPSHEALNRLVDRIGVPGAVSPLLDTREGYRQVDPRSAYANFYHKKRTMVFGNHVCNNHLFFSEQPIVGCMTSTFRHFRSINPVRRAIGHMRCRHHVALDLDYWASEPEHPETMVRAARVLDLEVAAIDYSSTADGGIVLWEANPFFSLHRWPFAVLAGQRQLKRRIPRFHDMAARFFADLLEAKT